MGYFSNEFAADNLLAAYYQVKFVHMTNLYTGFENELNRVLKELGEQYVDIKFTEHGAYIVYNPIYKINKERSSTEDD